MSLDSAQHAYDMQLPEETDVSDAVSRVQQVRTIRG